MHYVLLIISYSILNMNLNILNYFFFTKAIIFYIFKIIYILRSMPSFKFDTQNHLVTTTMTINNFIRQRSSTDNEFNYYANEDITAKTEEGNEPSSIHLEMQGKCSTNMEALCDQIRDKIVEKYYHV